ncbi:hypothetical protein Tcan_14872 [Toxocara canis]|uniref:Uncharacterized protein n=1 Tax=Toxocara canis TaxID=6265 RepID=A0A0B2VPH4_TOXCA|nr:hypothetical protein Tcan_14872 [Toxocara canis]
MVHLFTFLFYLLPAVCCQIANNSEEALLIVSGYPINVSHEELMKSFDELIELCGNENAAVFFNNESLHLHTYCIDAPRQTLQNMSQEGLLLANLTFSADGCNGPLKSVHMNNSMLNFAIKCDFNVSNAEIETISGKPTERVYQRLGFGHHHHGHHHHHHGFHHHHHGFHHHHHGHFRFYPHVFFFPYPYYYPMYYHQAPGNYSVRYERSPPRIVRLAVAGIAIILLLCGIVSCIWILFHYRARAHNARGVVYAVQPAPVAVQAYGQWAPGYEVQNTNWQSPNVATANQAPTGNASNST